MKKTILFPLMICGLVLAGCARTKTDSQKFSANNRSDPNKPIYDSSAAVASSDATTQAAVVAASTPPPATVKETVTEAPKVTTETSVVVAPTPTTPAEKSTLNNTPPATATATTSTEVAATTPAPANVANTETALTSKTDLSTRVSEWKLSADDIRNELSSSGQIVREKKIGAGEPTGPMDSLLISQVSSKLKDDAATSALAIDVASDKGVVTLNGSAKSLDQIGKAIAISLDTPGVTQTVSKIKLEEKENK